MLKGDIINGYKILQDFSTAGGGLSKWSFAEKGHQQYFIKEFLSPKYPTDDAPGSPVSKERKRKECEKFESHHKALMKQINEKCSIGGNLVFTIDFFRSGSKYYKITEKIDVASLPATEVCRLPLGSRILILKTVAHSLHILHKANIVHGDLKPDNVLIKQTRTNFYTTKLIDFDNSYFSATPPELLEDVVGDMVFYSPELARYIQQNEKSENLTTKSDIFALGLLYCLYLTGSLPDFSKKYSYACLACNATKEIRLVDAHLPNKLKKMVNTMLAFDPYERPDIAEIFEMLKNLDVKDADTRLEKERKSYVEIYWEDKETEALKKADEEIFGSKIKGDLFKKTEEPATELKHKSLKGKGLHIAKK